MEYYYLEREQVFATLNAIPTFPKQILCPKFLKIEMVAILKRV
jgi:hypothetical protein